MEDLSLIDVSGEDDFLLDLASPPQHPDPTPRAASGTSMVPRADLGQPAGGSQAAAARQVLDPSGATEQVPERTESPKKTKPKGGVNLRKSLAWDSAFFTGEGVLDTEELGIVNSSFRKSQGSRLLPGIAEEMRKSTESTTSTIESESFVLESLETELFDNVRASIQRTLGKPDKAPGVKAASSKNTRATAKAPPVTARKGVDRLPQTQSKIRPPVSTSNGCGAGSKQRPQVTLKDPTVAKVAVSRAAEVKPSSRPPRALPRVATMMAPTNTASTSGISDKRSSTGGVVNRANTSARISSQTGGGSKTISTSKPGALSSAASLGNMPGAKTKSPTPTGKGRAQRIPICSSSRSDISKVDPARASRSKIPTRSHGEGASPIISPSSSVDSMSSVISGVSTASTVGKASHTSETFSTRSSSLSPSTRKSNDHPPTTTVTEGTSCDNHLSTQGNGFKPSGLRRPTPKIGYFDPEKSVEQKTARAQLQHMKVLFSPLATPNPRVSSTPKNNSSFPSFDLTMSVPLPLKVAQLEVKPSKVTVHEASQTKALTEVDSSKVADHEASQTEALPLLPLRVVRTEVEPSKVTVHEASQTKALTEVDSSKVADHEASQTEALPLLPLRVVRTEVEPSKVTVHEASQTKALTEVDSSKVADHEASQTEALPLLPLRVVRTEVEPSKVTVHEASQTKALPEVDSSKVADHEASQTEALPLLPLRVVRTEVEPSKVTVHEASQTKALPEVDSSKVADHEASQTEALPLLPLRVVRTEVEPSKVTVHEASQTKALTEVDSSKVADHEASQTEALPLLPLGVVRTEVEPSKVTLHEASQTMCETGPLVAMDIVEESNPALHQILQASGDGSPLPVELSSCTSGQQESETEVGSSKLLEHEAHMCETGPLVAMDIAEDSIPVEPSSSTFDHQESETMAAPHIPSQSKASPSLPTEVTRMEVEALEDEACMAHACPVFAAVDTAKENIPALDQNIHPSPLKKNILASHHNIQAEGDMTPVKGTVLASHSDVQAIGDMTPVTLLTQKLSSISIGPATGDATPLTLLAQKLSSISLGDATD